VSKLAHLYRRKALYYWRRRLPPLLRNWFHKRHLFLSLRTADPTFARRLVVLLDAKLEEIVTAFEQSAMHLTPPQVDGLLRDVVTTHLSKLERLSAAAKSFPEFDAAQAKRDDLRAAWSYRLLHAQGFAAVVQPPDEAQMSADGMTTADIAAVQDHLAMLRINELVPTRQGILQKLLDASGAPATAMNLATAQDIYFRGMWMALSQSERRYGGHIVEADDFIEQVFKDRVRPAPGRADAGDATRSRPAAAADQATETPPPDRHVVDDRFKSMADLLIKKRLKEKRWTTKSKNQAEQIFTLMTRFMKEERSIENIPACASCHRASRPPSTGNATPLSCAAASEQRNAVSAPSSSWVVNPREGCFSPSSFTLASSGSSLSRAARASISFCTSGVSTQPGQIALQVTPVVAVSSATPLVKPTTPCLDATYADLSTEATNPCTDAMLMIRPQSRASICGSTARVVKNTAVRLFAITASQRSSGNSCTGATC
jgi:hypothetical protein